MKILRLENTDEPRGVIIKGLAGDTEFKQLQGHLAHIVMFCTNLVTTKTTIIKTGARHTHAKYLLFPASLRRQYKQTDYQFDNITCGTIHYQNNLYIIYSIPETTATKPPEIPATKDETNDWTTHHKT